ncbi:MAG: hypothetical protein ACI4S2_09295 [Lachnospiraceae bacterium]
MKRKLIIYLIIGIIIISQVLSTGSGRIFIDYWIRYARGEYDTNITVSESADSNCGIQTAYCDGKYYYYDKKKKGICEYNTDRLVVPLQEPPRGIAASEKYIYYTTDSGIYQSSYQGKEISDFQFPEWTGAEEINLNGSSLYCKCDENRNNSGLTDVVYIFDAENLSKKYNIGEIDKDWKQILTFEQAVKAGMNEMYIKKIGNDWLVAKGKADKIQLSDDVSAIKIYTEDINEGDFEILSGRDGKAMFHTQEDIMAIMNGSMYISEYLGSAVRLTGEKSWKRYGERLDTHLRRSRMKMDENVWLVLFEEYASFSLESSSEGSVGQYLNAELLYVDLKSDKVLENIPIKTGQVIYMDKEQYATFKNGTLEFYRVTDGEKIKEHKVKEYQLRKDYNVELCYDKLFFFCEDELIDVIEIKR